MACPHCGRPSPKGYKTCGRSECQEAEYRTNRERSTRRHKNAD